MRAEFRFDRIPPGAELGPHRHGIETLVYLAAGELVFEHGPALARRVTVRSGDVLYEAPGELHRIRNEGSIDALALLAFPGQSDRDLEDPARTWDRLEEPVNRAVDAPVQQVGGVGTRHLVRAGDFDSGTFTIREVELEPGAEDEWHVHPGSEHVVIVLEGRGEIELERLVEVLEPLKGVRIATGLPHRVRNTGRHRMRFYVCATPGVSADPDRRAVGPRPVARQDLPEG